jgi:hypothetical protein
MASHSLTKQILRLSLLSGGALHLVWGCSDSADEKIRAAELAQGCSINSDCRDPLVCAFERCHVACNEDRDCPDDLRCVLGSSDGINVCQLPDEVDCDSDKDCPGDQVCGVDEECRDSCERDGDCVEGQLCAKSNECASQLPEKDQVDESGNIVTGAGSGGSDGSGGSGSGSSVGDAGATSSSGQGGGGGQVSSGAGGDGEGGTQGPSAEGGAGATDEHFEETSDGVETVENNDREHAVPLASTASIFLTTGDQDWFKVETPNDGRAHVIELTLQQQAGFRTYVSALASTDYAELGGQALATGVTSSVFLTVGPGTTTLIQFTPYGGTEKPGGKRVDVSFQVRAEDDAHEPNNTRATSAPITLGANVSAQIMIPFASAAEQMAVDWYSVPLEAGPASVSVSAMPGGGRVRITRYNSENVPAIVATLLEGQTGDFDFSIPEAGTYYFLFERYTGFSPFSQGAEPAFLSEPYTFRVEQ